jgi:hypothetical protein
MAIEVVPKIFPVSFQNMVCDVLTSDTFPWYYNDATVHDDGDYYNKGIIVNDENTVETPQFTHQFCKNDKPNSDFFPMIQTMKFLLEQYTNNTIVEIERIKANLLPVYKFYPENCHHTIHVDDHQGIYKSFLYYVNDSDGDTIFFKNGEEVLRQSPRKGTGILFDSNEHHCSSPPKSNVRVVINMVLRFQ